MNTKNLFIGGLVGGVVFFLLGWLFYGTLLAQYFMDNQGTATNVAKAEEDMVWWALILGNILLGFLFSYIFVRIGVSTVTNGLITAGIIGFLICLSIDLTMYGTTNIMSKSGMVADIAAFTVMSAIVGAVLGALFNKLNRTDVIHHTTSTDRTPDTV